MVISNEETVISHIQEVRSMIKSATGKLTKSKISPQDYFVNLTHDAPELQYPELGISKLVVNICELVSTLLLEDIDETNSISKIIVMIFEYYFLVTPMVLKDQGARFINDVTFMKQFMKYILSLCDSRPMVQKELGNLLLALDLYNPLKDMESV